MWKLKYMHELSQITKHFQGDVACVKKFPFSPEMLVRAGLGPSHRWANGGNFRSSDWNTHFNRSETGVKVVLNESWMPVLFIPFVSACFSSADDVLWLIMSHFRPKLGEIAISNDFSWPLSNRKINFNEHHWIQHTWKPTWIHENLYSLKFATQRQVWPPWCWSCRSAPRRDRVGQMPFTPFMFTFRAINFLNAYLRVQESRVEPGIYFATAMGRGGIRPTSPIFFLNNVRSVTVLGTKLGVPPFTSATLRLYT